jgi:hypothetical protein
VLVVLTCIKPGVDAFRVASDTEIVEVRLDEERSDKLTIILIPHPNPFRDSLRSSQGHVIELKAEVIMTTVAGLFTEAIPGIIVQLTAIMSSGSDTSSNVAFSFVCCAMTAAFTSSNMNYYWDTNWKKRKRKPWFYGYVPDKAKGKVLVFLSLYFLSAFNLLVRALAYFLLQMKGVVELVAQFLGLKFRLFRLENALERPVVLGATSQGEWSSLLFLDSSYI